MILLSRRCLLAIAAVIDVALHARPYPVAAKALAARLDLPPRHLETLLQSLVKGNILKGVRGPRGGYELAKERRRITAAEIVRAALNEPDPDEGSSRISPILADIVGPLVEEAGRGFLAALDAVTVDELCRRAETMTATTSPTDVDFTI